MAEPQPRTARDVHNRDQVLDKSGHRSEAIANLVAKIGKILGALCPREPAVQHQSLVLVRHVRVGNVCRDRNLELGLEVGAMRLAALNPPKEVSVFTLQPPPTIENSQVGIRIAGRLLNRRLGEDPYARTR